MLQSEMYLKVSRELDIPLSAVIDYDNKMWGWVKLTANNPEADVIELPELGSFSITKVKMGRTLRHKIKVLRKLKAKRDRYPNNQKLQNDVEIQTILLRKLWILKKQCKFT